MRRLVLVPALMLASCSGNQSALAPFGPNADSTATLWWTMAIGSALITVLVMALALDAVLRPGRTRAAWRRNERIVIGGGLIFPIITLTPLLIYTVKVGAVLTQPAAAPFRVEVTGHMWWWEVRYPNAGGAEPLVSANEIRIPVGREVEVAVTTSDVIHSFWVPNLAGKVDLIPGHTNRIQFRADEPGDFRGQCAEYCGLQHARMAFFVRAEPEPEFREWLVRERRPAAEPDSASLEQGRDAFLANGCGSCHTVRGIPAAGRIGPDLTHVGSRLTLAAGTLPNNAGTLAAWIVDSQHLKPGNGMPPYNQFDGPTLRAIAAYLESLK